MRSRLRRIVLTVVAGLTLASGLAVAALALYARRPEAIAAALASEAADPVPRPAGVDDRMPGPMERLGHWLHARFLAPPAGPVSAAPARGFVLPALLGAPTTLSLTVRDAAGAAVAGARVALYGPPGVAARDAAVTDAAGLARFEGVPVAPGYAVAVARASRPTAWRAIDVPDGGAVEVRLVDARRLRGRVVAAATQQPVAGARVRFLDAHASDSSEGWTPWTVWVRRAFGADALASARELATVTTDATGAFEATVDGPAIAHVEARAPDGRFGLVEAATAGRFASLDGVEVPVARPTTVRGRLRDAAGAPIRDVPVRAVGLHLMLAGAPSRTDAEGRFEVVAPETDFLGTLAWTWPDGTHQSTDVGPSVGGPPVELVVPADPVVEVVVTDDATGAPVAGADVMGNLRAVAGDRSTPWAATARSDATGVARLRLPAGALVGVLAVAPGYGDARRLFEDPSDGDGAVRRVELALRRRWAVTGAIRRPGGAPAAGVRVRADVDSWRAGPEAVTDAAGRFRLEGVRRPPPDRFGDDDPWLVTVGIRAWLDGVGSARGQRTFAPDAAQGPEVDVGTMTLEAPAVLVGRVVDAGGRPVAGARVARERGFRFDDGTESDADGRFALALGAVHRTDETLAALADGVRRGTLAVRGGVAPGTAREVRTLVVARPAAISGQ